jgi:CheY-like chemotaxis protein
MKELKRILLVEDNPKDVELTLEALKDCKLANHVSVAKDGVEALEYLRCEGQYAQRQNGNPSVILMDIKMPRMGGLEALKVIRSDNKLKIIPVVILTSSREEVDLEKSYELGTNAYIVKPVDFKEFIDAVKPLGIFWTILNEIPGESGE